MNKLDLVHLTSVDCQISRNERISMLVLTDWINIVKEISVLTLKYVSNKRDDENSHNDQIRSITIFKDKKIPLKIWLE